MVIPLQFIEGGVERGPDPLDEVVSGHGLLAVLVTQYCAGVVVVVERQPYLHTQYITGSEAVLTPERRITGM